MSWTLLRGFLLSFYINKHCIHTCHFRLKEIKYTLLYENKSNSLLYWCVVDKCKMNLKFIVLLSFLLFVFLKNNLCLWPCVLVWCTVLLDYELLYPRDLEQLQISCFKGVSIGATQLASKAKVVVKATFPNNEGRWTGQKLSFELS